MESSGCLPPLQRIPTSCRESSQGHIATHRSITVTIPGVSHNHRPRVSRQVTQIAINRSVPPQTPDVESIFITNRTPRSGSPMHRRCQTVPASTNLSLGAHKSMSSRQTARTSIVDVSANVILEQKEYLHLRGVRGFFPPVKLRCKSSPAGLDITSQTSPTSMELSSSTPTVHDTICPNCREPFTNHPGGRCRGSSAPDRPIPAADSSRGGITHRQTTEQKDEQQKDELPSIATNQFRQRDAPWVKAFKVRQKRHTKMNELIRSATTHDMYHKWRLAPTTDLSMEMLE